jgi:hypothetical protein
LVAALAHWLIRDRARLSPVILSSDLSQIVSFLPRLESDLLDKKVIRGIEPNADLRVSR